MSETPGTELPGSTGCDGMGMALRHYPYAAAVLSAHLHHVSRLGPSTERFHGAAMLARDLGEPRNAASVGPRQRWETVRKAYLALLDREDWIATARAGFESGERRMRWLAEGGARGVRLRAFENRHQNGT